MPGFARLRATCQRAIDEAVVPGLAVAVGQRGATVFVEAFGARQRTPSVQPATLDTVYDLASLTKAIGTGVLVMKLVAQGRIDLDAAAGPLLPFAATAWDAARTPFTVRQLLAHSAGLPAHHKYYLELWPEPPPAPVPAEFHRHRDAILLRAATAPLERVPGAASVYSDLGFMLLGAIVEHTTGVGLDRLVMDEIARPLGLASLRFRSLAPRQASDTDSNIAATENCPWRKRLMLGEVHDQNAWAMGGVAGHAGLFGTVTDVAEVAHALCAAHAGKPRHAGETPLVERDVLRPFWQSAGVPGGAWRLGWDGPADVDSVAGTRISRGAVGHLGYTGTSLWIDPEEATFVVLLSNRVHPVVRNDPRFRALRADVNDAALADCGYRS